MDLSKTKTRLGSLLKKSFGNSFGIDLRALACLRIVLALILLADLAFRSRDLVTFYTDEGVLPRAVLSGKFPGTYYFSIHSLGGSAWFEAGLFLLHAFFALVLLLGYRTKTVLFFCWLLLISLDMRDPLVLQNGDVYLSLLFFWSLFLPLGARWSVDRMLDPSRKSPPPRIVSWGTVAVLLQVFLVYFFSGLYKSAPEWHSEGTAVYLALGLSQFTTPLGHSLLRFPALLNFLTHEVLFLEKFGVFFLFVPYRTSWFRMPVLAALAPMHLGFLIFMVIGIFPWVCLCALIPFLPSFFWDWVGGWKFPGRSVMGRVQNRVGERMAGFPKRVIRIHPTFWGQGLAGLFLTYVVLYNYGGLYPGRDIPARVKIPFHALFLEQKWSMFAPQPTRKDGWFVIVGTLVDGTQVDLWKEGAPVSWDRPLRIDRTYRSDRWHKYMINLEKNPESQWPELSAYLCRQWNKEEPSSRALKSLECFFMSQPTAPPGRLFPVDKVSLGQYGCDAAPVTDKQFPFPRP